MGKKTRAKDGKTKLSFGAFLQLESDPANVVTPRSQPALLSPSEGFEHMPKTFPSGQIAPAADYTKDWPTPAEVRARLFKGLCLECQLIFATWGPPNAGFGIRYRGTDNAHHSFEDLEQCWCPLCKMLLCEFRNYGRAEMEHIQSREHRATRSHVRIYKHRRHVPCYFVGLEFYLGDYRLGASFRMFITEDTKTSAKLQGRDSQITAGKIYPSTNCDPVWEIATKWLRTCRDLHEDCATTNLEKALPTRLLRIGLDNSQLRLVMSSSLPRDTEYSTLSHCWGSKPFIKLTRANLNAFLNGIDFESLSKTFKDAIIATRRLELHYLWIDSLCIVQNDNEDWQHEAVKMSYVYSNSSLNLAASDSPNGDTGLFFDERPDVPNVWKVSFPCTGTAPSANMDWDDDKERDQVYVWNCITTGTRAVIEESLLAKRAWTLQERLLPPRTLYFGREQIAWECRVYTAYEALPGMFKEGIMGLSPENFAWVLNIDDPLDDTDNIKLWSDIVEDYSKRTLTYGTDKLVAISGLAKILASVYGTNYVAGLWLIDLITSLVWHRTQEPTSLNEPVAYRAPSWSWASVDGPVRFPKGFSVPLEGEYAVGPDHISWPHPARVLEAATAYPEDRFGEVTGGFIYVRAQALFRVNIDSTKWLHMRQFPVHIRGVGLIKEFTAYPDFDLQTIDGESLLIPIASGMKSYPSDYPELRGLFLDYVEDGVYRRKGAWRIGGQYSDQGFDEMYRINHVWTIKGEDRLSMRSECELDIGEYACLWDGEAYNVKIL